jgi:Transposase IS200 like
LFLPPNLDLSRFVNNLKTTISRLVRRDFADQRNRVYRKPVFWSWSYCIISLPCRARVSDQAVRRAAGCAAMIFGLRPKPPSPPPWLRRGWSTGGSLVGQNRQNPRKSRACRGQRSAATRLLASAL